jgi:hypothetical protein
MTLLPTRTVSSAREPLRYLRSEQLGSSGVSSFMLEERLP